MTGEDVTSWAKAHRFTVYDLNQKESFLIGTTKYGVVTSAGQTNNVVKYGVGTSSRIMSRDNALWTHFRGQPDNHALRHMDLGGDFALEQVTLRAPQGHSFRPQKGSGRHVDGLVPPSRSYETMMTNLAAGRFPGIPSTLGRNRTDLISLGSTAIARSLPNVPEFSAPRFLGELAQGLPQIPGKALLKKKNRKFRNVGGEYLNFQFGVAPTLNDLGPFIEYLSGIKKAIRQTHYGETTRVRKVIDKGTSYSKVPYTSTEYSIGSISGTYTTAVSGSGYISTTSNYKIWSSITFVYDQVRLLDQMISEFEEWLGFRNIVPTAVDVYNLVPYTWLVDWFANFNHVVTNLSYLGRDGLYLRHGYIMATYDDFVTHECRQLVDGRSLYLSASANFKRKYRVKASPFGFGLTFKDLDGFQTSILAALGVNRLRF
jgi:hypothetical protein